jgi:hypothetical protein
MVLSSLPRSFFVAAPSGGYQSTLQELEFQSERRMLTGICVFIPGKVPHYYTYSYDSIDRIWNKHDQFAVTPAICDNGLPVIPEKHEARIFHYQNLVESVPMVDEEIVIPMDPIVASGTYLQLFSPQLDPLTANSDFILDPYLPQPYADTSMDPLDDFTDMELCDIFFPECNPLVQPADVVTSKEPNTVAAKRKRKRKAKPKPKVHPRCNHL